MTRTLLLMLAAALLLLGAVHVHGALAWVVCAPFLLALDGEGGRARAALAGAAFGAVAAASTTAPWVAVAAQRYFDSPVGRAWLMAAALTLGCGSCAGALLGIAARAAARQAGLWPIVLVGAVWAAWESLLVAAFPHYPWVTLAATQGEIPIALQAASVLGQSGVSWAVAGTGTALALAMRARRRHAHHQRAAVLAAIAIPMVVSAYGWTRLRMAPSLASPRCVLGTVDAGIESERVQPEETLERYESVSRDVLDPAPSAIVWPESALPGYPLLDGALQQRLRQRTRDWNAPLIAGGPRVDWSASWGERLFNSAYRIDGAGAIDVYDKQALVPFAEYWPFGSIPRPHWLSADAVTPGSRPGIMAAGACRLGVLICFEAERPGLARELAAEGVDALLVLSNDAHLPEQTIAMEVAQARLRAVETGLPVVRAANRGVSALIDPFGRAVLVAQGGTLRAGIPPAVGAPATQCGPLFLGLCWLATMAVLVAEMRQGRTLSDGG